MEKTIKVYFDKNHIEEYNNSKDKDKALINLIEYFYTEKQFYEMDDNVIERKQQDDCNKKWGGCISYNVFNKNELICRYLTINISTIKELRQRKLNRILKK